MSVTDQLLRNAEHDASTRVIALAHQTACGTVRFTGGGLKAEIEAETGVRPPVASEAFSDAHADVRRSVARIGASASIPHEDDARGFLYDVGKGTRREVR